ncbi:hypothetical protein Tco_1335429 [Tanacetum coccineum]
MGLGEGGGGAYGEALVFGWEWRGGGGRRRGELKGVALEVDGVVGGGGYSGIEVGTVELGVEGLGMVLVEQRDGEKLFVVTLEVEVDIGGCVIEVIEVGGDECGSGWVLCGAWFGEEVAADRRRRIEDKEGKEEEKEELEDKKLIINLEKRLDGKNPIKHNGNLKLEVAGWNWRIDRNERGEMKRRRPPPRMGIRGGREVKGEREERQKREGERIEREGRGRKWEKKRGKEQEEKRGGGKERLGKRGRKKRD